MERRALPLAQIEGFQGQRPQRGFFKLIETLIPRDLEARMDLRVDPGDRLRERLVDLGE